MGFEFLGVKQRAVSMEQEEIGTTLLRRTPKN